MSDQDLFAQVDDQVDIDETKNYLEELVGENKKYKDNEALAKAAIHKDLFIDQLKTELSGIREDLTGRQRLEDLVEKLASAQNTQTTNSSGNQPTGESRDTGPALTADDLRKLAREEVIEHQNVTKRNTNLREVDKVCREKLGANYAAKLRQQAISLDMDPKSLNEVAANNPKTFYRLMGLDQTREPDLFSPPKESVNSAGLTIPKGKDKAFYDNLRKTDSRTYWSIPVQKELHALKAKEMGL